MPASMDQVRSQLLERRQELKHLSENFTETLEAITLDEQILGHISRMDAMHHKALAEANERQRKFEIRRIDTALRRIEEDEYGYCGACGDEIAERRLEVNPSALFCMKCAK